MMIWHRQLDYIKLCYGFTNLDVFMFLFTIRCKGFYLYKIILIITRQIF